MPQQRAGWGRTRPGERGGGGGAWVCVGAGVLKKADGDVYEGEFKGGELGGQGECVGRAVLAKQLRGRQTGPVCRSSRDSVQFRVSFKSRLGRAPVFTKQLRG